MLCSSKIHNTGYILLNRTPLKTPEILEERFAVVSLQTKKLAIVIKVAQMRQFERYFVVLGNFHPQNLVLKKVNRRAPTTIKKLNDLPDPPFLDLSCLSSTEEYFLLDNFR